MTKTAKPRKIILDLFHIGNRNVGLGEFAYQLGLHIARRAPQVLRDYNVQFTFIVPRNMKGCYGTDVKYVGVYFRAQFKILRHYIWGYDLYHALHQFGYVRYMQRAKHNMVTVHDINFKYEKKGSRLEYYTANFAERIKKYDVVNYISEFAKMDVLDNFTTRDANSRVIYNGVADLTDVHGDFEKFHLKDNGYFFHISSILPKKNVHKIVEMMRYMPEETLVVVGDQSTKYAHEIRQRIKEWNLQNVKMLDRVSNEDKAELYRHCKAFLFPSLCEGFGLPPIEVMYFGKPVFLSTLTSLPEVGGDVAYYYTDFEPEKMAEVTRKGCADYNVAVEKNSQRIKERAAFFDWNKTADAYIQLYIDSLKEK